MNTDPKEQPVNGAPDLKLAIADWGGDTPHYTHKQAASEEDEISPRSMAVVRRSALGPAGVLKTAPTGPGWDKKDRPSPAEANQPDHHLNDDPPTATASTAGLIAEIRRVVREELFEALQKSQVGEGGGADHQRLGHAVSEYQTPSQVTAEWGDFFTPEGHATPRFGQIMKALSGHIIRKFGSEDNGLVMTPDGLQRLYAAYQLDDEVFPFLNIFSSRSADAYGRIAEFLVNMECQHHLVQPNEHSPPLTPALTVIGFAQYYMSCILAYPDTEFHRLRKIIADVPPIVVAVSSSSNDDEYAKDKRSSRPETLSRIVRRNQQSHNADPKSKQFLDGAFENLMYDLGLPPPRPSQRGSPSHQLSQPTTTANTRIQAPATTPEPRSAAAATAVERADSSPALTPTRSTSHRKYVQPSSLHTIGDDDDDDNANGNTMYGSRDRERELERASMSGPRPVYTRQHSWHPEPVTGGAPAGVPHTHHHRQASEQQRYYAGHASHPPPSSATAAAQASGGSAPVVPQPSAAGPARSSVSSNASSLGYWGHGGRTPPPTRHNSTSAPDVSSNGPLSLSSSSSSSAVGMTTPAATPANSSGPVSPAASMTPQWNPLQYRPPTGSRTSSSSGGVERQDQPPPPQKAPHHVRWGGVTQGGRKGSEPSYTAATTSRAGSVSASSSQAPEPERRSSQRHHHGHHGHHHHRRFPSSGGSSAAGDHDDYDNNDNHTRKKGETWEEFLRAQRKGEGYHQR